MQEPSRGRRAIEWIENYCQHPDGPFKGERVRLSLAEKQQLRQIYDAPNGPDFSAAPLEGPLAAYVALLHLCGKEATLGEFRPPADVDTWTVWRATSECLQRFLKREGEAVICPGLGTRYPPAAA
jgi:hypothetical protein